MRWIADVLTIIAEEYGVSYSDARVKMWSAMLGGYGEATVKNALLKHLRSEQGTFAPKAADIIVQIEGSVADKKAAAAMSWQRVRDALGTHGTYRSVVFDDERIHYAISVAFGDWVRCGLMTESEEPFRRNDFIAAFCAYSDGSNFPNVLHGVTNRDRSAQGLDNMPAVYIGEAEKCKRIEGGSENKAVCSDAVKSLLTRFDSGLAVPAIDDGENAVEANV